MGGLLLAAGAAALFVRKGAGESWGTFALLLVVLIPAMLLYALAIAGASRAPDWSPEPWRTVLLVSALLILPFAFLQFLEVVGADAGKALWVAGAFAFSAALAAYGVRRARVRYGALLSALALLVTWLIVWVQILAPVSGDTFRVLLVAGAAVLLLIAVSLDRSAGAGAAEVATAGGLAAVLAGVLGIFVGTVVGVVNPIERILSGSHGHRLSVSGLQSFWWDLYLLVVSVALISAGARIRSRGMGYVGGFGLLIFIISVGSQVTRIESGKQATASLAGWPLVLLILGALGLFASTLRRGET